MKTEGIVAGFRESAMLVYAVLAVATSLSGSANAGSAVRLAAAKETAEATVLPGFSAGAWRDLVQLVWDRHEKRLVRRNYRVWDPLAAQGYALTWLADDVTADRDGTVTGSGRLVWREKGAASYDKSAAVARFIGTLIEGHAEGQGVYLHRAGASYRGSWKNGLMDGHGRLQLPNGDEYAGFFQSGKRHGNGVYIGRTGIVYEGGFAAGLRDGMGRIRIGDGPALYARWQAGNEVEGSRVMPADPGQVELLLAKYDNAANIEAGLVVDRRQVIDPVADVQALGYTSQASGEVLKVLPDNARLFDVWRGRVPIQITQDERFSVITELSFLGPIEYYQPTPFILDLSNLSEETVRIAGGYIDVSRSVSDREPAVQVDGPFPGACQGPEFTTAFDVQNFGWSDMSKVKVTGTLAVKDKVLFELPLQAFEKIAELQHVDYAPFFKQFGIEDQVALECDRETIGACQKAIKEHPSLEKFAEIVTVDYGSFVVPYHGEIAYEWADANGETHMKTSSFDLSFQIAYSPSMIECGEGGTEEGKFRKPFKLKADGENYRIPLQLADDIPPGVTGRWRVQIESDMSAVHDFRIVLQLADGRDVATRPVNLTYFKPRPQPEKTDDDGDEYDGDGKE
ncbi:hypothetical protein [Rhizobium sp. SL86]|uniref:hypothetical protein n=1 Tax=Rhizobium sp. SL86 TaxID=2995148 RepID=UPI0022742B12|nr:hypothetical protein [Rhizobium sp. SL86]MCY1669020.1 hypothetical protein [Rhizobium sp. SL86]